MSRYAVTNSLGGTQQAMGASYKTLIALTCQTATLGRFRIYELMIGTNGTPADNYLEYDVSRQTAAGTGTIVTANPVDGADAAAGTLAIVNATAEGTITAASSVFYLPWNQRASLIWRAATPDDMLIAPAVNLAGFAIRARSGAYTGTIGITTKFQE
jgi:hypothetical protein